MTKVKVKPEHKNSKRWERVEKASENVRGWSDLKKRARAALRTNGNRKNGSGGKSSPQ